jgi:hypothetical protein
MKQGWQAGFRLSVILIAVLCLWGCSGIPARSVSTAPATIAYTLGPSGSNTIVGYSTVRAGNDSPIATLHFSPSFGVGEVATDPSGAIYAAGGTLNKGYVRVYPPNSIETTTPLRTIDFNFGPNMLAVDPAGRVYILSLPDVVTGNPMTLSVYSANASETATPLRTLVLTNILPPIEDIAADSDGNIYIAGYIRNGLTGAGAAVAIFPTSADGPSLPSRTISFPANSNVFGVAVDAAGDIFVNVCPGCVSGSNFVIEEFAPHASGAANPINTINLPIDSGSIFTSGGPVRLDGAGNIFTTLEQYDSSNDALFSHVLYGFHPNSTGSAVPSLTITPPYSTFFAVN